MRRLADEKGVDLLVVDSGDRSEGNGLYDASDPKGVYTRRILRDANHYDLLTSGNHELYNGTTSLNEFHEMVPYFGDRYLSTNIEINKAAQGEEDEWVPFANRHLKFRTRNLNLTISAFGFLFDFTGNDINTRVTPVYKIIQEPWFIETIQNQDTDLFLIICHIDVDFLELSFLHGVIRQFHPTTPIQFMAGHAHQRKFKVFDDYSTALESGRYCETAGWLSITGLTGEGQKDRERGRKLTFSRRYIDYNRNNFMHHSQTNSSTFDTSHGVSLSRQITSYRSTLDLNRLIGCAPQDFTLDKSPYPSSGNWYSYLSDTILPTMITNPSRNSTPHVTFINAGSQRFDIFRGPFTYDTSFLVSPFTSRFLFKRDVPWKIAKKLLKYFIEDPNPYLASIKVGETPAWDERYDAASLVSIRNMRQEEQKILESDEGRKWVMTPGYTTMDDHGSDGDDTVHTPYGRYRAPKVIESRADWPEEGVEDEEVVDVVFFDFIAGNVEAGLRKIAKEVGVEGQGGNGKDGWGRETFERYMPEDVTLTGLLLEFVEAYWKGVDGKCSKNRRAEI